MHKTEDFLNNITREWFSRQSPTYIVYGNLMCHNMLTFSRPYCLLVPCRVPNMERAETVDNEDTSPDTYVLPELTNHRDCCRLLLSSELVLGLMLSVSRSIPSAHDSVKRGEWAKRDFNGRTLNGKILGIVGFGSVGQEVIAPAPCLRTMAATLHVGPPQAFPRCSRYIAHVACMRLCLPFFMRLANLPCSHGLTSDG